MDIETSTQMPSSIRAGRYQLKERLGSGGMAAVFRAWDRDLGVERAIKLLRPEEADRASFQRRLRAEAHAMARVQHPHILTIHDVGTEGSYFYVVTPIADGGSLCDRLDREGALPPAEAVSLTLQVLDALASAHAVGVVHRDVKPANVLLDYRGRALLADFGIALDNGAYAQRRTRAGSAMGSPAYMPPEQRVDARSVDVRADVYAAGAMLYELLTAMNPADLYTASPSSSRWDAVPVELVGVLQRATAMQRGERFPSVAAFAQALLDASEDAVWGEVLLVEMGEHSRQPSTWARSGAGETIGDDDFEGLGPAGVSGTLARGATQDVVGPLAMLSMVGGTGMFLAGIAAMAMALVVMVGRGPGTEAAPEPAAVATSAPMPAERADEAAPVERATPVAEPVVVEPVLKDDASTEQAETPEPMPVKAAAKAPTIASTPVRLSPTLTQEAHETPSVANESFYAVAAHDSPAPASVRVQVPSGAAEPGVNPATTEQLVGHWRRAGGASRARLEVSEGRRGTMFTLTEGDDVVRFVGSASTEATGLTATGEAPDGSALNLVLSSDGSRLQGTLRNSDGQTKLVSFTRL